MAEKICDDGDVVLIVDDEEMIVEMIGNMVERHGCQHVSFTDPTEALRYYTENSQKITLIITDLTMPKLSGPDLIRRVCQINSKLPIIIITGYADEYVPDDVCLCAHRVLSKPFVKADVVDAVRTALNAAGHQDGSTN